MYYSTIVEPKMNEKQLGENVSMSESFRGNLKDSMGNLCPAGSFDTDDFLISQEYDIMTVTRHMFRIMYIVLYHNLSLAVSLAICSSIV